MQPHVEIPGRAFLAEQLPRSPGPRIAADPDAAAGVIFRLATSIMLSPSGHIPLDTDEDLRAFAWAYLVALPHQSGLGKP
ncbi:MAG TPA: hypothetical protein VGD73_11620 [Pseudonocardia sp.]|jgi:hypothetical protein|uniref:hypothetical protein n=1 Tax=Pseudonocardia sp. TaxID=60912 RepID=UPI002ED89B4E